MYASAALGVLLLSVSFREHREASALIGRYQASESAIRLLESKRTFHFYQIARKRNPMISPIDLSQALEDVKNLKEKETNTDFILTLAEIRHLLGPDYPADFAAALARMEMKLPETESKENALPPFREAPAAFADETVALAVQAYFPPDQAGNDRYAVIDYASAENGFSATAFKGGDNRIVIAFRGSDETKDVADAERIIAGKMPAQFENAEAFYKKLRRQYPDAEISSTGHSLGGTLAQLLAVYHDDVLTLTCNPMGTRHLIRNNIDTVADSDRIFNLTVSGDKISSAFPQVGRSLTLHAEKRDKYGDLLHPHSVLNCLSR